MRQREKFHLFELRAVVAGSQSPCHLKMLRRALHDAGGGVAWSMDGPSPDLLRWQLAPAAGDAAAQEADFCATSGRWPG